MTKKQFDELLKTLKGIEAALLLLRVPNTVYVPLQPTYPQPTYPQPVYQPYVAPNTNPYYPTNTTPRITCNTQDSEVEYRGIIP